MRTTGNAHALRMVIKYIHPGMVRLSKSTKDWLAVKLRLEAQQPTIFAWYYVPEDAHFSKPQSDQKSDDHHTKQNKR